MSGLDIQLHTGTGIGCAPCLVRKVSTPAVMFLVHTDASLGLPLCAACADITARRLTAFAANSRGAA